ncbi:MAG TPA: hypothetical protein VFJ16_11135 [Longimicrobium sp.]|nr:hypothetical protein [Longimicrobium sp.]
MYPPLDGSRHTPNFVKTAETPSLDIGWGEGVLGDGRPWRAELWAEDGITMLTFFFSTLGIEAYQADDLVALLTREGLLGLERPGQGVGVMRLTDPSGNQFWSVNVVVGTGDEVQVGKSVPVQRYPGR